MHPAIDQAVSQAGQIDFVRLQQPPNRTFRREHRVHQVPAFRCRQVGHLLDMLRPNNAAEAGVVAVFDQHHPAQRILPQGYSACIFT